MQIIYLILVGVCLITAVCAGTSGTAQWVKSASSASETGSYTITSTVIDSNDNMYTACSIRGTATYDLGNGVTVAGIDNSVLLIKYNPSGVAQWAKSVITAPSTSTFNGLAVDSHGNVYAAGSIQTSGTYDFGDGVTVAGKSSYNILLVKYNSSGVAQWAKSVSSALTSSSFQSVAVDLNGDITAVGAVYGSNQVNFGDGAVVSGAYSGGHNLLVVKYNSSGVTQWAMTTSTASEVSRLYSVAVDTSGNIYAAGYIRGAIAFDLGNGVTVAGKWAVGENVFIAKYSIDGVAQWSSSVSVGHQSSSFSSVYVSPGGGVLAVGQMYRRYDYEFGTFITASGAYDEGFNVVLVQYGPYGGAQWAKSLTAATAPSSFQAMSIDSNGNIYAAGYIMGTNVFDFGNGVTVNASYTGQNVLLVKYDSAGVAQWAKSVAGTNTTTSGSVAVDSNGGVYVSGSVTGGGVFDFGDGVTVTGRVNTPTGYVVKYINTCNMPSAPTVLDECTNDSIVGSICSLNCAAGSYSTKYNNSITCTTTGWTPSLASPYVCNLCSSAVCASSRYLKVECSPSTNNVCELCSVLHRGYIYASDDGICGACMSGFYGPVSSNTNCSEWTEPECDSLSYEKTARSTTSDRVCEMCSVLHRDGSVNGTCGACSNGFFGPSSSNTSCSEWTVPECDGMSTETTSPSSTADRVCTANPLIIPVASIALLAVSGAAVFICVHNKKRKSSWSVKTKTADLDDVVL